MQGVSRYTNSELKIANMNGQNGIQGKIPPNVIVQVNQNTEQMVPTSMKDQYKFEKFEHNSFNASSQDKSRSKTINPAHSYAKSAQMGKFTKNQMKGTPQYEMLQN